MGCCSSSRRAIPIYVPVPEHGSGFLHWGDVNCVRAMQYLLTWYGTATPQEKQLYTEPYCVHPPAQGPVPTMDDASAGVPVPRGGRHPAVLVTDPEGELHHVMLQLHDRLRSSKGGTPPAKYRFDVSTQVRMSADLVARRVHAALYMHLPLLIDGVQRKKVAFVGELDTAWINAHLPSRFSFTEAQMRRLVSLFNEINVTHTGGVTLHEFERWVDAHTPDDAEAEVRVYRRRPVAPWRSAGVLSTSLCALVVPSRSHATGPPVPSPRPPRPRAVAVPRLYLLSEWAPAVSRPPKRARVHPGRPHVPDLVPRGDDGALLQLHGRHHQRGRAPGHQHAPHPGAVPEAGPRQPGAACRQ